MKRLFLAVSNWTVAQHQGGAKQNFLKLRFNCFGVYFHKKYTSGVSKKVMFCWVSSLILF